MLILKHGSISCIKQAFNDFNRKFLLLLFFVAFFEKFFKKNKKSIKEIKKTHFVYSAQMRTSNILQIAKIYFFDLNLLDFHAKLLYNIYDALYFARVSGVRKRNLYSTKGKKNGKHQKILSSRRNRNRKFHVT